jgi:hypothetical protein
MFSKALACVLAMVVIAFICANLSEAQIVQNGLIKPNNAQTFFHLKIIEFICLSSSEHP